MGKVGSYTYTELDNIMNNTNRNDIKSFCEVSLLCKKK